MDFMAQVRLHDGPDDPSFMMCWMHKGIRYLISLSLDILLRYMYNGLDDPGYVKG